MRFFLSQHYPFFESIPERLKAPKLVSVLIFLFGLASAHVLAYKPDKITSFAFVLFFMVVIGFVLTRWVIPLLLPSLFKDRTWTVGKEIVWVLFEVGLTVTASYVLLKYIWQLPYTYFYATWIATVYTYLMLLVFIVPLILVLKKQQLLERHVAVAKKISMYFWMDKMGTIFPMKDPAMVTIPSNDKSDDLQALTSEIYYIKSTDNYVEVYFKKEETVQSVLLRNSLSNIGEALAEFDEFYRCHRSYIVNLSKIKSVMGNARGYQLLVEDITEVVPVSRNKIESFNAIFRNITSK